MRTFVFAALSALVVALFGMAPASAAGTWSCVGGEYVCGGSSKSVAAHTTKKAKHVSNQVSHKAKKSASYDSDARPLKKKRSHKVARSDDAPRKAKRQSSGGGSLSGMASYYWQPQKLASGGWFNPNAMTAAHKSLPFGTKVRVTNKHNGKSVVVTINDRGPYVGGRIIDLSKAAAGAISMQNSGVVPVNVAVLGR